MNTSRQSADITPAQLRAIWTAARDQGLAEDLLRDLVQHVSGQRSTRALTRRQASTVIDQLRGGERRFGKNKFRELDGRPDMATGAQLRKIEAMWRDRAFSRDKQSSLRQWLTNRFAVADLRFLTRQRASDVIVALEKMEVC